MEKILSDRAVECLKNGITFTDDENIYEFFSEERCDENDWGGFKRYTLYSIVRNGFILYERIEHPSVYNYKTNSKVKEPGVDESFDPVSAYGKYRTSSYDYVGYSENLYNRRQYRYLDNGIMVIKSCYVEGPDDSIDADIYYMKDNKFYSSNGMVYYDPESDQIHLNNEDKSVIDIEKNIEKQVTKSNKFNELLKRDKANYMDPYQVYNLCETIRGIKDLYQLYKNYITKVYPGIEEEINKLNDALERAYDRQNVAKKARNNQDRNSDNI